MKDKIVTALLIIVGLVALTSEHFLINFIMFVLLICLAIYWMNNTTYGKKFVDSIY